VAARISSRSSKCRYAALWEIDVASVHIKRLERAAVVRDGVAAVVAVEK
jgi:hypothetical protein